MKLPPPTTEDAIFVRRNVESAIRIGALGFLVIWSFRIMRPFFEPVMWGVILAVAVFPAYNALATRLGNRRKLTAGLFVVVALAALLIPSIQFIGDAVHGIEDVAGRLEAGTLSIPPPPAEVRDWPLIGEDIDGAWRLASTNFKAVLARFKPQLEGTSKWLLTTGAGLGWGVLQFLISIIIAGVFLVMAGGGKSAAMHIGRRFAGDRGAEFVVLAERTIRSVAVGVLGVAVIQSVLAGLGMAVVGVPAAALWALLILIVATVQLPVIVVLGPVAVYVFSAHSTVPATIFLVWALLVSFSDTLLKPLLLGRGVEVPTLVILIGAIGGLASSGIIGLFLGAVILALVYQLFMAWLNAATIAADEAA